MENLLLPIWTPFWGLKHWREWHFYQNECMLCLLFWNRLVVVSLLTWSISTLLGMLVKTITKVVVVMACHAVDRHMNGPLERVHMRTVQCYKSCTKINSNWPESIANSLERKILELDQKNQAEKRLEPSMYIKSYKILLASSVITADQIFCIVLVFTYTCRMWVIILWQVLYSVYKNN